MALVDIMGKLKLGDILSEDELRELQSLGTPKAPSGDDQFEALTRKEKEANAKAARILEEKKRIKAENEVLLEKLEKLESTGLSDVEKLQKDLEKSNKSREKMESELKQMQENHASTLRSQKLGEIQSKVRFLDTIPNDMIKMSIESAFKKVEDLSDESAIAETLKSYMETHKGIIAAENKRSNGMIDVIPAQGQPSTKAVEDMSKEERASQLLNRNKGKNPILSRI